MNNLNLYKYHAVVHYPLVCSNYIIEDSIKGKTKKDASNKVKEALLKIYSEVKSIELIKVKSLEEKVIFK